MIENQEVEKPRRKLRISISPFLTLFFILLKVTGVIDWSWWWVLCPLWLPLAGILLAVVLLIFITCGFVIYRLIKPI
jgi:hypothetical protein